MTDPIADLLTRIRNAIRRGHKRASVPHSKMKESILKILKDKGFIMDYTVQNEGARKTIEVEFKYVNGESMIHDLKRMSSPGVRIYAGYGEMPRIKRGLGIVIVTTSKGVMTGERARKEKVGGELICTIS